MNDLTWLARNVHEWPDTSRNIQVRHGFPVLVAKSKHAIKPVYTHDQWLAERERLQNKPSWDDAPEWAKSLGQDADGEWNWLPHYDPTDLDDNEWMIENSNSTKTKLATKGEVLGDWRDTLEKKPEQMQRVVTDRRVTNRGGVITVSQTVDYKPVDQARPPTEEEMCSFSGPTEPKHINCRCVMTEAKQEWKQGELPPVGTTALFCFGGSSAEWSFEISQGLRSGSEVEILAHFSPCKDGDLVAVFAYKAPGGRLTSQAIPSCFHPLKTEEEKAVEEIVSVISEGLGHASGLYDHFNAARALYRAGYRKP